MYYMLSIILKQFLIRLLNRTIIWEKYYKRSVLLVLLLLLNSRSLALRKVFLHLITSWLHVESIVPSLGRCAALQYLWLTVMLSVEVSGVER